MSLAYSSVKRGDTIVEIMFAFAIFSLVAIITVTMMNMGLAAGERSLEITTVRNEINAQAEALRFIHSSYIAEMNLPQFCDASHPKCQQFTKLWQALADNSMAPPVDDNYTESDGYYSIKLPVAQCEKLYDNNAEKLVKNNAFVLNTRRLPVAGSGEISADAYIKAEAPTPTKPQLFFAPELSARIIYSQETGENGEDVNNSTAGGLDPLSQYIKVARVEGIWVVGVKSENTSNPQYFDFYIGSCWQSSGSNTASTLDTIVRLYNPR